MYGGGERCRQSFGAEIWGISPLGRPRPRWNNNIKMDLEEVRWGDWYVSGYEQVAGSCECGNELSGSVKCGGSSHVYYLNNNMLLAQNVFHLYELNNNMSSMHIISI
jgi:hypothetical protein